MLRKLYAIRDTKVGTCNPPCIFDNDAVAMRGFGDLVSRDKDSMIALHPEDFVLLYLGEIDLETGVITQTPDMIRVLCTASDFNKGN